MNGSGSLPVRGAWIEIARRTEDHAVWRSLPVRGAWIEIERDGQIDSLKKSLPVRGAWIEIVWKSGGWD